MDEEKNLNINNLNIGDFKVSIYSMEGGFTRKIVERRAIEIKKSDILDSPTKSILLAGQLKILHYWMKFRSITPECLENET